MWVYRRFAILTGLVATRTEAPPQEVPPPVQHTFMIEGSVGVTGFKPPISYFDALNQFLKGFMSTGVFVMGYAFKHSGIIGGCIISVILYPIMLLSVRDLSKVAKRVADREAGDVRPNLAETVQYTMERGPKCLAKHSQLFGTCTMVFVVVCELGSSCVCYAFIASHIQIVLNNTIGMGLSLFAIYAMLFAPALLVSMVGSMKTVTPVTIFGNILMAVAIFFYMLVVVRQLEDINDRPFFVNVQKLPMCIGYYIYSMEGASFVLSIKNEMKNPEKFDSLLGVINVGVTVTALINFSMGFISFWKFGNETKGTSFENLNQQSQLVQALDLLVAVALLCSYSFHMYIPFDLTYPKVHEKFGPFKHRSLAVFFYKTVGVIITFVLAAIIPELSNIIHFNGSLMGGIIMITPNLLYLVEFRESISWLSIAMNMVLIIFNSVLIVIGTYESLRTMLTEFIGRVN